MKISECRIGVVVKGAGNDDTYCYIYGLIGHVTGFSYDRVRKMILIEVQWADTNDGPLPIEASELELYKG